MSTDPISVVESIVEPMQAIVEPTRYKNIEEATGEINKLKEENIKRRWREKESQELIKKMEEENAVRFSTLEKQLRDAKLAKHGIEKQEEVELFEFYSSVKNLNEADAIEKVKSVFKNETAQPQPQLGRQQTGFVGKTSTVPNTAYEYPSEFGKLSTTQKIKLLEENPQKYNEMLIKFKGR